MIDDVDFLGEGGYTRRDDAVMEIAGGILQGAGSVWGAISKYVASIRHDTSRKNAEFRKRTASDIIESGYVSGCTDVALVFVTLARACDIPTKYVETFDEEWLRNNDACGISGHIFVDVLVGGQWNKYEPKTGFIRNGGYNMGKQRYTEVGKGLDFSETYIKENGVYRAESTNLQSLDEAVRIFKPGAACLRTYPK